MARTQGLETQVEIDRAYDEGKAAYRRDTGTHGPTLQTRPVFYSKNPYPDRTKRCLAWTRGYNQDVRRVVAEIAK